MKVHFHKEGTDIIPQKFFWFALPGLIKVRYRSLIDPFWSMQSSVSIVLYKVRGVLYVYLSS